MEQIIIWSELRDAINFASRDKNYDIRSTVLLELIEGFHWNFSLSGDGLVVSVVVDKRSSFRRRAALRSH